MRYAASAADNTPRASKSALSWLTLLFPLLAVVLLAAIGYGLLRIWSVPAPTIHMPGAPAPLQRPTPEPPGPPATPKY